MLDRSPRRRLPRPESCRRVEARRETQSARSGDKAEGIRRSRARPSRSAERREDPEVGVGERRVLGLRAEAEPMRNGARSPLAVRVL